MPQPEPDTPPTSQGMPQPDAETRRETQRPSVAPARLQPGSVLAGRYKLLSFLGHGGMGAVYRAWHADLEREVAVKTLLAPQPENSFAVPRFLREARACMQIRHRHAVGVLDLATDPETGRLFMVMDLCKGRPLSALLRHAGPFTAALAVQVCWQVLDALAEAHRLGIIHRDIKPANVMVHFESGSPEIKVLDFGISRAFSEAAQRELGLGMQTLPGALVGTPGYMSPQQAAGQSIDPRSDIFACGVLLHELLTGERPWPAADPARLAAELHSTPPRPLPDSLPAWLRAVVARALQPKPEQRFPDARSFQQALSRGQSGSGRLPSSPVEAPAAPLRVSGLRAAVELQDDPYLDRYARPLAPLREELAEGVRVAGTTWLPEAEAQTPEVPLQPEPLAAPRGIQLPAPATGPRPRPSRNRLGLAVLLLGLLTGGWVWLEGWPPWLRPAPRLGELAGQELWGNQQARIRFRGADEALACDVWNHERARWVFTARLAFHQTEDGAEIHFSHNGETLVWTCQLFWSDEGQPGFERLRGDPRWGLPADPRFEVQAQK